MSDGKLEEKLSDSEEVLSNEEGEIAAKDVNVKKKKKKRRNKGKLKGKFRKVHMIVVKE